MSSDTHQRGGSGSGQPIRGITRLVNPPEDDHEVISGEADPVERDYLGASCTWPIARCAR